jgi:hypothetical protein
MSKLLSISNSEDFTVIVEFPDKKQFTLKFRNIEDEQKFIETVKKVNDLANSIDDFIDSKKLDQESIVSAFSNLTDLIYNPFKFEDIYLYNEFPTWTEVHPDGGAYNETLADQKCDTEFYRFTDYFGDFVKDNYRKKFYKHIDNNKISGFDLWFYTTPKRATVLPSEDYNLCECSICKKRFPVAVPYSENCTEPLNKKQGSRCSSFVQKRNLQDVMTSCSFYYQTLELAYDELKSGQRIIRPIVHNGLIDYKKLKKIMEYPTTNKSLRKNLEMYQIAAEHLKHVETNGDNAYFICGCYGSTNFDYGKAIFRTFDKYQLGKDDVICDWCLYQLYKNNEITDILHRNV